MSGEPAFLLGVDEAGRAPLAGPVAVGTVAVPARFDVLAEFPGVRDSKKLALSQRERIYELLVRRAQAGDVAFCVRFSSHRYIDEHGITKAVRRGVWGGVRALAPRRERRGAAHMGNSKVYLDGLLRAPRGYAQETIIGGDDLVPLISLASVAAKVERDRLMCRLAKKYPPYGFEKHKGYPTAAHYQALEAFGLCAIHRRRFCRSVQPLAQTPQ